MNFFKFSFNQIYVKNSFFFKKKMRKFSFSKVIQRFDFWKMSPKWWSNSPNFTFKILLPSFKKLISRRKRRLFIVTSSKEIFPKINSILCFQTQENQFFQDIWNIFVQQKIQIFLSKWWEWVTISSFKNQIHKGIHVVLSSESIVINLVPCSNHFHKNIPSFQWFHTHFDHLFHNFTRNKMFQLLRKIIVS